MQLMYLGRFTVVNFLGVIPIKARIFRILNDKWTRQWFHWSIYTWGGQRRGVLGQTQWWSLSPETSLLLFQPGWLGSPHFLPLVVEFDWNITDLAVIVWCRRMLWPMLFLVCSNNLRWLEADVIFTYCSASSYLIASAKIQCWYARAADRKCLVLLLGYYLMECWYLHCPQ